MCRILFFFYVDNFFFFFTATEKVDTVVTKTAVQTSLIFATLEFCIKCGQRKNYGIHFSLSQWYWIEANKERCEACMHVQALYISLKNEHLGSCLRHPPFENHYLGQRLTFSNC